MTSATVAPEDGSTDLWGTLVSEIQTGVSVSGKKITGTLHYLSSGQLVTDWGEGYFLALKFSNFTSGLTYSDVKVGLAPTMGAGMQTLDSDQNAVFKITDKNGQKFAILQEKTGKGRLMEFYDLSGLTLEEA